MSNVKRLQEPSIKTLRIGKVFSDYEEDSYDLRGIFVSLNIYSSLDEIITTGDVTIQEQGNLISEMPIVGEEYIEIEFCSLDDEYEPFHRVFFVYAVDSIDEATDTRSYVLRFTDALGLINNDTRLAIRYKDKFENIIDKIEHTININSENQCYREIQKKYVLQDDPFQFKVDDDLSVQTNYEMNFVSPMWKPLQLIPYLARRAVSADSDSLNSNRFCDCHFFQNRKGEFIFTNYKAMFDNQLEDIHKEGVVLEKRIGNSASNSLNGAILPHEEPRYTIINYSFPKIFNVQMQKARGLFGFTDNVVDFLNVKCEPVPVSNVEIADILSQYKLDTGTEFPYSALTYTENSLLTFNECGIDTSPSEMQYEKFTLPYQKSLPVRQTIEYAKMTFELNGCSDLDIGRYVYVDLGMAENPAVSAYVKDIKWVVSKISHVFTRDGYKTFVECFTPYLNREIDKKNQESRALLDSMMTM